MAIFPGLRLKCASSWRSQDAGRREKDKALKEHRDWIYAFNNLDEEMPQRVEKSKYPSSEPRGDTARPLPDPNTRELNFMFAMLEFNQRLSQPR